MSTRKTHAGFRHTRIALACAAVAGVLAANGALAQESDTHIDSVDYFLAKSESTLTQEHPFHTPQSQNTHGAKSPLTIWEGDRNSILRGTLKAEVAYYPQNSSWFGNSEEVLGKKSDYWWEAVVHPGVEGSYFFENNGELYGRLSFVHSSTDDVDAAGSDVPFEDSPSSTNMENAYIGWRSGDTFALGKDFLELSIGMQDYSAGTGFLLYDFGSDGGKRGGYWIGERKAGEFSVQAKFKYESLKVDLVYMEPNDKPDSSTELSGLTVDYELGAFGSVGGGYYYTESDIDTRDEMDTYDIRFAVTPFQAFDGPGWLDPLSFEGEYVHQDNDDVMSADGWFLSAGYNWADGPWAPAVTYRYAAFEGDDPDTAKSEDFDPLYYGFYDWGTWFQGEILGEYALLNSNLNSHMLRLNVSPTKDININLFYYIFELDDAGGFGVSDDKFADEVNLTVDWTVTDSVALSFVAAVASPDDGAEQAYGGDDDWSYGMVYMTYSFK